jgi:N-acetylglucosaminyldiphosphoundecaprenol N-acetyl-beta-D-mannosaminyltransferase
VVGARKPFRRVSLLGGDVDLITREGVMVWVDQAVREKRKAIVANQNLHSLYLMRREPDMAAFYALADIVEIDSMPLVYWGRLLGFPASRANRCTYLDWRDEFWRRAAAGRWRIYCLGAPKGVAQLAARRLMREWPGVEIRAHHGYFDHAPGPQTQAVLDDINRFEPDVLLVGMGMPVQETWIARNFDALSSGVVLSVGAAFDYEAGLQKAAPRILGALCLEWLYRLLHQPRRLARRYLVEPWSLIGPALTDLHLTRGGAPARPIGAAVTAIPEAAASPARAPSVEVQPFNSDLERAA